MIPTLENASDNTFMKRTCLPENDSQMHCRGLTPYFNLSDKMRRWALVLEMEALLGLMDGVGGGGSVSMWG